ncbi:MAG: hypothetical protein BWX80_01771 [Candidatus Hydrogenedentes bacterium ADurb.Bin101]|nr:MAG: hypothetical protein BWX80_01771 [Candidatus Hydrogenedentes bacterium ADurb.Bin101]
MGDKIVPRFRERAPGHNFAQQKLFIHSHEVQGIGFVDLPVDNRGLLIAAQLSERDRFRQQGLDIVCVCRTGTFRGVQRLVPSAAPAFQLRRQRVARRGPFAGPRGAIEHLQGLLHPVLLHIAHAQVIEGIRILGLLVVACDHFNGSFEVFFRLFVVPALQVDLPETGIGRDVICIYLQRRFVVLHIVEVRVAELFQFQARKIQFLSGAVVLRIQRILVRFRKRLVQRGLLLPGGQFPSISCTHGNL